MVTPQEIERVQTQEVRDVLWAYKEFYYLDVRPGRLYRVCGCDLAEGRWPDLRSSDGVPLICEAHAWQDLRERLQCEIVSAGLSMPIPKRLGEKDLKGQTALKEKMGSLVYHHPLFSFPQIVGLSRGAISASQTAAWIAAWLSSTESTLPTAVGVDRTEWSALCSTYNVPHTRRGELCRMEHVVFYVHHSQALNLLYERRNREIEDVLLWAPVLVYFHNRDGRENGWTRQLIESRQYGLVFIVEE